MSSPFQVCKGTCLCAPAPDGYGQGKVLYCFGEVVLQRANLRPGEDEKEDYTDVYHIQIAQLVTVTVLLAAVVIVLITIRRGLLKLEKKIKKILLLMSMSPPQSKHSTLEKNNVSHQNGNGVKYFPPLDNMSLNSEAV
eukprot:TRINITY_DN24560_c0_g1_i1.p1 TRINITY_DN24560_c0_g1~~TRINITY_DN24560_c0_g1_i1.p1  ORF type:complete len:138 (-),score=39.08 TRINITY_DN24560_c0_g1_i1:168-581(-)